VLTIQTPDRHKRTGRCKEALQLGAGICAARKLSVAQSRAPVEQLTVRVRSLAAPRAGVSTLRGAPRAHLHYPTRQANAPAERYQKPGCSAWESPPFARDAALATGAWARRTSASCVLTTCGMRGPGSKSGLPLCGAMLVCGLTPVRGDIRDSYREVPSVPKVSTGRRVQMPRPVAQTPSGAGAAATPATAQRSNVDIALPLRIPFRVEKQTSLPRCRAG
jgi:hypothetical protein